MAINFVNSFAQPTHKLVPQSNLVFAVDFNDSNCYSGSGSTVTDLVGGLTGNIVNATYSSANGGFFVFNGVDAGINFPNFAGIDGGNNPFSVVVVRSALNEGVIFFAGAEAVGQAIRLRASSTNSTFVGHWGGGNYDWIAIDTHVASAWIVLTEAYSATSDVIYSNRFFSASSTTVPPLSIPSPSTLYLGQRPGGNFFQGSISACFVYNRKISQTEHRQIYNLFKNRYGI